MDKILDAMTSWLEELLGEAVLNNLTNMVAIVNEKVGTISADVSQTPANFSPGIYNMIRNVSETVIIPIAGIILTIIACYELIQLIIEHNHLQQFETWIFLKWIFKTYIAIYLISNTFTIVMAVFDVAQHVVNASAGIITGSTALDSAMLDDLRTAVQSMGAGELFGLYIQTEIVLVVMNALSAVIFVIIYARMIEIYMMVSMAPIPFATFGNKEQSHIGQNYLRSIAALAFQAFLIIICVGIYAVLIQTGVTSTNVSGAMWGIVGYTVLLCFTLFKTGSLAKSIFAAH